MYLQPSRPARAPLAAAYIAAKQRGIVCMTGIVDSKWSIDNFSPMDLISTAVSLTTYDVGVDARLEELVKQIAGGTLQMKTGN